MKPEVAPLFSVPFALATLPEGESLCGELSRLFLAREAEGERHRNQIARDTQHGLFESKFDLHTWPDAPVQKVFGFIHHSLAATLQQLCGYSPETYAALTFNYHSWFHVTRNGGHQGVHNHPMASWSGILCVDPGDASDDQPQSGAVRFLDTRQGVDMYRDSGNEHLGGQYHVGGFQYRHQPGRLVMFPSYVLHEVFPYRGTRPRIVIAFNAWIHGAPQVPAG